METQTHRSDSSDGVLGLGSVLIDSLPAELMTADAPARYTVEAVFTRRPDQDEVRGILGSETRVALARAGYPAVELTVSDRRLVIANTSLEELRDGLSQILAERLAEISAGVRSRRDAAAVRVQHAAETEHDRLAAVTALAESVRFDSGSPGSDRDHHADGGDPPVDGHAH